MAFLFSFRGSCSPGGFDPTFTDLPSLLALPLQLPVQQYTKAGRLVFIYIMAPTWKNLWKEVTWS